MTITTDGVPFSEQVRTVAESLVASGETLLAVGRAAVSSTGVGNTFAIAVTDRRLAWAEAWSGSMAGNLSLDDVVAMRERDDGKDIRLELRGGSEQRLRFGGPTARALAALRAEVIRRGASHSTFSREPKDRARALGGSSVMLRPVGRFGRLWGGLFPRRPRPFRRLPTRRRSWRPRRANPPR